MAIIGLIALFGKKTMLKMFKDFRDVRTELEKKENNDTI